MTRHDPPATPTFPGTDMPLAGTIAGVLPYDFSAPTPGKIRSRLWDPHSERVIGPHLFGIGWSPNFGALAVRLGLIEPDAEDVQGFAAYARRFEEGLSAERAAVSALKV